MKTLTDGANELLREAVQLLGDVGKDTVLVGGWGPYIRNLGSHPGTKDVDILFPKSYTRDDIAKATKPFLDAGFLLSAKHDFQLFRPYRIGNHSYVFNVDLLHPVIQKTSMAEFMDIIDLDITFDGKMAKAVKTICIVGGNIMFDHKLYVETNYSGLSFNTLSPTGIVLSKLQSCENPKRPRDIYDIYLSVRENPNVGRELEALAEKYDNVSEMLEEYRGKHDKKWKFYRECLMSFSVDANQNVQRQLRDLNDGT